MTFNHMAQIMREEHGKMTQRRRMRRIKDTLSVLGFVGGMMLFFALLTCTGYGQGGRGNMDFGVNNARVEK